MKEVDEGNMTPEEAGRRELDGRNVTRDDVNVETSTT
jgi:hypothetical protein